MAVVERVTEWNGVHNQGEDMFLRVIVLFRVLMRLIMKARRPMMSKMVLVRRGR